VRRRRIKAVLYMILGIIIFVFLSFILLRNLGLIGIYLIFFLGAILSSLYWLWMLVDCITKESNEGNTKIAWLLIILFTHLLGALIYYLVRRPQRLKELGR
jgi:O-antigen/teichoic acid export membrane protein